MGAAGIQLFLAVAAVGQTWNGTPGGNWGTASNWTPATIPNSSSATATFNAVNLAVSAVLLGGPFTVGTLNLNNRVSGGFFFEEGTLQLAGQATINVQSHDFAPPDFDASATINIQSNATINTVFADSTLSIASAITDNGGGFSLTKTGPGILTLEGTNNYSGGTTILDGTLQLGNDGTTGSILGNVIDNGVLVISHFGTYTFTGNISGTGALQQLSAQTTILTGTSTYTGGTTISDGTLQLGDGGTSGSILGNVIDNGVLAISRSDTYTFTGNISGTGALQQLGTGTTILTGTNTYTGGTTISAGTLQLGNGGTSGSILGNVIDNGVLAIHRSDTYAFSGNISGTGALQQLGTGTTILTGTNTYTGGTIISAGTLQLGDGGTAGSIQGTVINNATLVFDRGDTVPFGGVVSGGGNLAQIGPGTTILTGNNTYSGGTTILAGTLQIGNSGITGNIAGNVNVNNNSTLAFDRSNPVTFGGVISGTGSVRDLGGGILTMTGNNSYSGGTTIASGGTLQIGAGGSVGSIVGNVTNNGIFAFDRSDAVTFAGVISGTGSVQDLGGGTLTLLGGNTYAGGTVLNNGTLIVGATDALGAGPVSVNSLSLLQINPGVTITNPAAINNGGSLINGGTIQVSAASGPVAAVTTPGGATIANQSGGVITGVGLIAIQSSNGTATITNSGVISGTVGIAFSNGGTVTNNPGGTISGSSGIAIASSGGSTNLSNAGIINGNVTLGNGANTVQLFSGSHISGSLNLGPSAGSSLILDGSSNQTYSSAVTGSTVNAGSLTKQGSGNWLIDVAMNAPVSTNVLAGVLEVNGSLQSPLITVQAGATLKGTGNIIGNITNLGTLSPGNSPGTLTINGNLTLGPAGVYNVEIVSPQSYSRLVVTGRAILNGTLQLTLASGFRPTPGEKFVVLSAGQGVSGTFRSVIDPGGPPFQPAYENGAVVVSTAATQKTTQVFLASDGNPSSTTALFSDYVFFNNLGSLAGRTAAASDRSIGITFDAGEFDFEGQHGQTYGFPIAGHLKLTDRVALDYEIPLQYVDLPESSFFEAGAILNFPIKMLIASETQPWSWNATPTAAIASTGSKEIIGAGALSNVVSCRWRNVTMTYGNYISFFEGETLVSNDPAFPKGTSQQIMKNGLKVDIPFGKGWILEAYGIYTQFFQSAAVSSYYTIGAEVGRHIVWKLEDQQIDLGYYSVGLYTEQGNHYNSGHLQFGSGWKF